MGSKKFRSPSDSAVEATHLVLPQDTNALGTAFGGKIMEWMDIAAAVAAGRHVAGPVVTVAVDDMHFSQPIRLGDVVVIHASVNHTGRTSMEVGVKVDREDSATLRREHCLSGYFTFVGVDKNGRPIPIPQLTPQTDSEKRRYENAELRRQHRLNQLQNNSVGK